MASSLVRPIFYHYWIRIRPARFVFSLLFTISLLLSITSVKANEQAITKAWQLVDSQQFQPAYDLLAPLEAEQAGEPVFDYLLGVAALGIDQPGLALFPLERVIAVQPDYPGARLAIAQAYLMAGNIETAKKEYEVARQEGQVNQTDADKFNSELKRRTIGSTIIGASIDLTLGIDDNVTSATSENTIETPVVTVTLDDDITDVEDSFTRIRGSAWMQKPLSRKYKLIAAGNILGRFNQSEDEQDYSTIDARIGLGNRNKDNKLAAYLFTTSLDRDSESYQDSFGLLAQWRYSLGTDSQLHSYIRTAQLDYDDQDDRDSLLTLLSVSYVSKIDSSWSPVYYAGISGGSNDPDSSDGDEFGYSLTGLNAGIEFAASENYRPYAYLSYMERDFDEDNSIFATTREDERVTLRLGADISHLANWTIKPELVYTDNDSNIAINDYDRTVFTVTFRRIFN